MPGAAVYKAVQPLQVVFQPGRFVLPCICLFEPSSMGSAVCEVLCSTGAVSAVTRRCSRCTTGIALGHVRRVFGRSQQCLCSAQMALRLPAVTVVQCAGHTLPATAPAVLCRRKLVGYGFDLVWACAESQKRVTSQQGGWWSTCFRAWFGALLHMFWRVDRIRCTPAVATAGAAY